MTPSPRAWERPDGTLSADVFGGPAGDPIGTLRWGHERSCYAIKVSVSATDPWHWWLSSENERVTDEAVAAMEREWHPDVLTYLSHADAAAPVAREDTRLGPWATLRFDPNVRVRGNQTMTGYEDVLLGVVPRAAQTVRLVETESGLTGEGIVTAVDREKRLIYVAVDWSRLRMPDEDTPAQPAVAPDTQVEDRTLGGDTRNVLARAGLAEHEVELVAAFFAGRHSNDDFEPAEPSGCGEPGCTNPRSHRHEPINVREAVAPDAQSAAATREALVRALEVAEVVRGDADDEWHAPDTVEAERMADVALGVLRDAELRGPSPDEPATALRSVYIRLVDSGVDSTTEPAESVRIDWTCTPDDGWVPVGVEVLGASGVEVDGEDVLRGGGAGGGGEDEALRPGDEVVVWGAERNRGYAVGTVESGGTFPRGIVKPVVHLRTANYERVDDDEVPADIWEAQYESAVSRLARAAGVSTDSEDPVGAIEAAIRAGREPEVVTGKEAAELPMDSIVIECAPDGVPMSQVDTRSPWAVGFLDEDDAPLLANASYLRVLYRAPAPTPAPLTVGEVVENADDLDRRATVGVVVRGADGEVHGLLADGWSHLGGHRVLRPTLPARVLDVPDVRVGAGGDS